MFQVIGTRIARVYPHPTFYAFSTLFREGLPDATEQPARSRAPGLGPSVDRPTPSWTSLYGLTFSGLVAKIKSLRIAAFPLISTETGELAGNGLNGFGAILVASRKGE